MVSTRYKAPYPRHRARARIGSRLFAAPQTAALHRTLTKVFVVFVFLLSSTGLLMPLLQQHSGSSADAGQGSPVTQVIWLGVYAVTLAAAFMRWPRFLRVATSDKLLLALVCFVVLSVLWSAVPEVTLQRSVALGVTMLFGAYLAMRFSPGEQLRLLAWALGISAWLSLLIALALPSYGISSDPLYQGDWQGVFSHKNSLGSNMALGSLALSILALTSRRSRWILLPTLAVSLALLWLADSKTALVVFAMLLALWPLYQAMRWRHLLMVPLTITLSLAGAGVLLLLVRNYELLLAALGRNATLTGRTELWDALLDMIQAHPWLGYGYSAFWLGWDGPSAKIWLLTGSEVPAADNAYLELLLNVGAVGLGLFLLGFLAVFYRAIVYAHRARTSEGLWPLAFLTFLLLYSTMESVFLRQNDMLWILYVATALSTFTGASRGSPRLATEPPLNSDLGRKR